MPTMHLLWISLYIIIYARPVWRQNWNWSENGVRMREGEVTYNTYIPFSMHGYSE